VFDGKTPPSKMVFTEYPFWVQVHDMPLRCMNMKIGQKIGDSLGKVEVVVTDDDVGWGKCLRIRVVIDLLKPLDCGRALVISRESCWVSFKYEKLPSFCYRCGRITHDSKGCPNKSSTKKSYNEGAPAWGAWLRAEESKRGLGVICPEWPDHSTEEAPAREFQATDSPRKGSRKAKGKAYNGAPKQPKNLE
jgi:tRNA A37 threonylcarbamoyladenosine biosynthesis protein TsaE